MVKLNYKDYQNARDLAWNILIKENISELPVNVVSLCKQLGIKVKYYIPLDGVDGECIIIKNTPYILINKNCSKQRKRFTIAHELGHILLGHIGKCQLVNSESSLTDNDIEQQANCFAVRLLAPACVLWGCKVKTADDIIRLCDVSKQCAEYRIKRLNELKHRKKFLSLDLEKQVFNQFKDFILDHQHLEEN